MSTFLGDTDFSQLEDDVVPDKSASLTLALLSTKGHLCNVMGLAPILLTVSNTDDKGTNRDSGNYDGEKVHDYS